MCAISGHFTISGTAQLEVVRRLIKSQAHRGPDDSGYWINKEAKVCFGHNRLSILELTEFGHQPMIQPLSGNVITFNGEIYNHPELRRELSDEDSSLVWRGSSDTETLLNSLDKWGIRKTLTKVRGMFAFAFYSSSRGEIYLARDEFGEKPLYYSTTNGSLYFASDSSSLARALDATPLVSSSNLDGYLRLQYIPEDSIFDGVRQLPPGTFIRINCEDGTIDGPTEWTSKKSFNKGNGVCGRYLGATTNSHEQIISSKIDLALDRQLRADVPVGAFLSGGVDSSLIVAKVSARWGAGFKTFTMAFPDSEHDESRYARLIAERLGTNHTEVHVSRDDLVDAARNIPNICSEPFADQSMIPTYLLCKAARKTVKVVLTGDGGDEIFGGYNRYKWIPNAVKLMKIPGVKLGGRLIEFLESRFIQNVSLLRTNGILTEALSRKIRKFTSSTTHAESVFDLIYFVISQYDNKRRLTNFELLGPTNYQKYESVWNSLNGSIVSKMLQFDRKTYLPNNILFKTDRASMAVGLEARVPFLDPDVVGAANDYFEYIGDAGYVGKGILKNILQSYLPRELYDRPKMGFGCPMDRWLRLELKEWAEDLLFSRRTANAKLLDERVIGELWLRHQNEISNNSEILWTILVYLGWARKNYG